MTPKLETCSFLSFPAEEDAPPARALPADCEIDPFRYLPPRLTLSDAELDMASRYLTGDFSGGYIPSQIAYFRRGPSADQHAARREKFAKLKAEVERLGLVLPNALVALVESDDYVARLRHNSIWLRLPDEIVSLPSSPDHKLFLIFADCQGCGYWHLLLAPDGGHIVTLSEHGFGLHNLYAGGYEPDIASFAVYRCADSFSQWIVNFFEECTEQDRRYDEALELWRRMAAAPGSEPDTAPPEEMRLHFSIRIDAPPAAAWETMLGSETYKEWTAVFCEGSYYEGSWEEGERIRFLTPNGDGVIAVIAENRRHEYLAIMHVGLVRDGVDDTESPAIRSWAPAYEIYSLASVAEGTELNVDHDVPANSEEIMLDLWPKALAKLKALVESRRRSNPSSPV